MVDMDKDTAEIANVLQSASVVEPGQEESIIMENRSGTYWYHCNEVILFKLEH